MSSGIRPLSEEEIDRLKNPAARWPAGRDAAAEFAAPVFVTARTVFGAGAYGHPVNGTLESVQTISRDDLVRLYRKVYQPRNAAIVFAGDLNLEKGKAFAEKYFGDWKNGETSPNESPSSRSATWKPQTVVVDLPDVPARPGGDRGAPHDRPQVARLLPRPGHQRRPRRWIRIALESRDSHQTRSELRRQAARSIRAVSRARSTHRRKPRTNPRPRSPA